ncbi:hypothetical protein NQ318_004908 [Aromia moschata]|uniref:Uncharacterized protein n=1 Tax=Aromia moschata TaxID=1265417 RepID=A0AAV8YZJ2_9CUCU|nr:hypothetical protein NQ318_004908 [Aromia moschata]
MFDSELNLSYLHENKLTIEFYHSERKTIKQKDIENFWFTLLKTSELDGSKSTDSNQFLMRTKAWPVFSCASVLGSPRNTRLRLRKRLKTRAKLEYKFYIL